MARDVKPLTRGQREQVLAVAREHAKLKALFGGRNKVVFVEPNLTGRGKGEHPGQAVVGFHDYRRGRSVVALVDPQAGKVVGIEESPAHLQLSAEERKEANELAGKDTRVRDFLAGRALDPLTRLYFPPGGDESHRHAIVFVRPNRSERRYAVVDLTARKVIDVLEELATRGAHGA
jgi:hypothetical protein